MKQTLELILANIIVWLALIIIAVPLGLITRVLQFFDKKS